MQFDTRHLRILRDLSLFSKVKRYQGMLPAKLAVFYEDEKVRDLIEQGIVERYNISFPCGSHTAMLRLTEQGKQTVASLPQSEAAEHDAATDGPAESLSPEHAAALADIYHFSKIQRYGGMMPESELNNYDLKTINQLYALGFVARVSVDTGTKKKRKGLIVSEKALRYLTATAG